MSREVFVIEQQWADGEIDLWEAHVRKEDTVGPLAAASLANAQLPREGMPRIARVVRYVPAPPEGQGDG